MINTSLIEITEQEQIANMTHAIESSLRSMSPAKRFRSVRELMHLTHREYLPAARLALASALPNIARIDTRVDWNHDDQGGVYSFVDGVTLVRRDGAAVELAQPDDSEDTPVAHVRLPDGEAECGTPLLQLREIAAGADDNQDPDERHATFLRHLAAFAGSDDTSTAGTIELIWETAIALFHRYGSEMLELAPAEAT